MSIIGSLLANLLLTLGLSTVLSSSKNARSFHYFNVFAARVSGSLLALILASFIIPTVFAAYLDSDDTDGPATDATHIAGVSRAVSVLLALMYLCLLVHQFRTHRSISSVPPEQNTPPKHEDPKKHPQGVISLGVAAGLQASVVGLAKSSGEGCYATKSGLPTYFPVTSANERKPKLHLVVAITLFIITAGLLAACVEFTVQSIDELTSQAKISQTFVGLVLVPIPNCDLAPISHALEGDFQKSIDLTIGKCLQTTLFVYPLCVVIGWGLGIEDANFAFDTIHVSYIFATVFLLNLPLRRGRISWYAIMPPIIEYSLIAHQARRGPAIDDMDYSCSDSMVVSCEFRLLIPLGSSLSQTVRLAGPNSAHGFKQCSARLARRIFKSDSRL